MISFDSVIADLLSKLDSAIESRDLVAVDAYSQALQRLQSVKPN
jgi:hypothetical protein